MKSPFEKMMEDFNRYKGEVLLEKCMEFSPKEVNRIPLRYRIIALGFVKKMSLEELNRKLEEVGCERLYARNLLEAELMYAFSNGLDYRKWKELQQLCADIVESAAKNQRFFAGKNITYSELKEYVETNSDREDQKLHTRHITAMLEEQICNLSDDLEQFRLFLMQNISSFSGVREKARYYYCKYLYLFLRQRMENYQRAVKSGIGMERAMSDLLVLKGITPLKRKQFNAEEIERILNNTAISCGKIYDVFNYFYFEYVSSDWMEVLMDYYGGNILNLPEEEKSKLAHSIRVYCPQWRKLDDHEVIRAMWQKIQNDEEQLNLEYTLDGTSRGYQKNRSGEKSVRNYIRGNIDIDRTTLICYLIFFGNKLETGKAEMINVGRINQILQECGFTTLREADEFDYFIIHYFKADDPVDYLMESVTYYALKNKNSFLYHMYYASFSNEKQLKKVLLPEEK